MELEFDKEIDVILRKARDGGSAALTAVASPHPDADAIAAFAENALPDRSKLLYIKHFADCDGCRHLLSQSMLLNSEADATAASSAVRGEKHGMAVPWYAAIFRSPSLAMTMGALVLAFAGILGYLVVQNSNNDANTVISKVTEPQTGAPYSKPDNSRVSTSNSNSAPAGNSSAANSTSDSANSSRDSSTNTSVSPLTPGGGPNVRLDKDTSSVGATPEPAKPTVFAAAPPAPVDQPKTEVGGKAAVEEKAKEANEDDKVTALASRDEITADRKVRELQTKQAKRNDGPSRSSGQVQQENGVYNNSVAENKTTKQIAGKSFSLRHGVWYDVAYHGQATKTVRRGSDEYKKLDGGVRNIADTLGETVVVVWKEKAYRIQ
jgi:hypothetical protein